MPPFLFPWNEAALARAREACQRRAEMMKVKTGPPAENADPGRCWRSAGAQKQIHDLARKSNSQDSDSGTNKQATAVRRTCRAISNRNVLIVSIEARS